MPRRSFAPLDHVERLIRQEIPPEPSHSPPTFMQFGVVLAPTAGYVHYDPNYSWLLNRY
jgi:hypothetical protein